MKTGSPDIDVAIVGAGLSGLAAAHALRLAGRSPVVFESTDRVGGRQLSGRLAGQVVEEGALFFGPHYALLRRQIDRLGLRPGVFPFHLRRIPSLRGGRPVASTPRRLASIPGVPAREKAKLLIALCGLAPAAPAIWLSLSAPESRRLDALDRVSGADYLSKRVGDRFVTNVVDPLVESLAFTDSRGFSMMNVLQLMGFGAVPRLFGMGPGIDTISREMARDLDVRFGCSVRRVSTDRAGARIECDTGRTRCRDAVVAVPAPRAAELLDGDLAEAAASFEFSSALLAFVAVPPGTFPDITTTLWSRTDAQSRIGGAVTTRHNPQGPVVASCTFRPPAREELWQARDGEVVAEFVAVLEEALGEPIAALGSRVRRWDAAVPLGLPGTRDRQRATLRLAGGRPHLAVAGDWLTSFTQEGALASGFAAARAIAP